MCDWDYTRTRPTPSLYPGPAKPQCWWSPHPDMQAVFEDCRCCTKFSYNFIKRHKHNLSTKLADRWFSGALQLKLDVSVVLLHLRRPSIVKHCLTLLACLAGPGQAVPVSRDRGKLLPAARHLAASLRGLGQAGKIYT